MEIVRVGLAQIGEAVRELGGLTVEQLRRALRASQRGTRRFAVRGEEGAAACAFVAAEAR